MEPRKRKSVVNLRDQDEMKTTRSSANLRDEDKERKTRKSFITPKEFDEEQFPPKLKAILRTTDDWSFNTFKLTKVSDNRPIQILTPNILKRYGLIRRYRISPMVLISFLERIDAGYKKHKAPYHNHMHGADVLRNFHYMLQNSRLKYCLSKLEIFACLIAALIHNFEHTGTTNSFHVATGSHLALLYNDRMVQQNHHVSAFYTVLRTRECNILANLTAREYDDFRSLVIEMVLCTDMAYHFRLFQHLEKRIKNPGDYRIEKSKVLALTLHVCDICAPAKKWEIASRWAQLGLDELFAEGDMEQNAGLPISPQCDPTKIRLPEAQIHFIQIVVEPSLELCGNMLDYALPYVFDDDEKQVTVVSTYIRRPWESQLQENKKNWKENFTPGFNNSNILIHYVMSQ